MGSAATVGLLAWVLSASLEAPPTAEDIARENVRAERARQAVDVERVAVEFHRAWTRSDLGQVKAFLHEDLHEPFWPQVEAVLQRRGWTQALPPLGDGAVSDHGDGSFDVRFPLAGGEPLLTRWMCFDGQWRIGRFLLPPE